MFLRFSPRQMQVMTWWLAPETKDRYDAVICDGSVRSGKTLAMSISFLLWAMTTYDQKDLAICGKTAAGVRRNVIIPLLRAMSSVMECREQVSRGVLLVSWQGRQNRFHLFGGKDEGSAAYIQGMTLAGVLLDEAALMPRSFVEQALARCSVEGSRFWFNCNPEGPGHWFYQEWICRAEQRRALRLHFTMADNPSLSTAMRQRYERMYTGVFHRRYILGEWCASQGLVYPMFDPQRHLLPEENRRYVRYWISCDYGTANPMSMGLWGQWEGKYIRIAEYYYDSRAPENGGRQQTDEEYYEKLEQLAGGRLVERVIVDPSAASFIQCIRRHGRFSVAKAVNEVVDGIRRVAGALGKGNLLFQRCCKDTVREFGQYVWDETAPGDRPRKEHDHAMDDIRYFVSTVMDRPGGVRF